VFVKAGISLWEGGGADRMEPAKGQAMETMLRSVAMSGYFDVTRRLGLNPVELVQQLGIDPAALANPDDRVSATACCRLLELTADKVSCPTFALQMAETRQKFGTGVMNVLLAHKRTLREVLLAAAEFRHLLNEALAVYILARHSSALLGEYWKPRAVHFTHRGPADLTFHRRFFGCPLEFGSDFNGFVCAAAGLDYPNPASDPELVRYAESLATPLNVAGADSIALEVRKAIYLLLPVEQASVERVARHLRLSVRTMQRQLGSANTSFSALVDEVRRELAVRYISNPRYPIGRVAALLGYNQQGSFTNWFTSQFGMTPRDWRNSQVK